MVRSVVMSHLVVSRHEGTEVHTIGTLPLPRGSDEADRKLWDVSRLCGWSETVKTDPLF